MKYECVCVCVCLDSSVATLHKYMYAHTYYVCLCVCAPTFIASLALHCNFVCNAALLREGVGGGRYLGYVVDGNE